MAKWRVVCGVTFDVIEGDLFYDRNEHDILLTKYGNEWEAHVHEKGPKAEVVCGPFRSRKVEVAAMWALERSGERAGEPSGRQFRMSDTNAEQTFCELYHSFKLANLSGEVDWRKVLLLAPGEALDVVGRQIIRVR